MIKYFLYSSSQMKFMREMEAKRGKKFKVGSVIFNGSKKAFTELSSTDVSPYTDGKVVASGDTAFMTYTLPYSD